MIKNLNDLLSFVVLFIIAFFSLRVLIWSFVDSKDDTTNVNRWQLLRDYIDNTEE